MNIVIVRRTVQVLAFSLLALQRGPALPASMHMRVDAAGKSPVDRLTCTNCGDCVAACPEIVQSCLQLPGPIGLPDFNILLV